MLKHFLKLYYVTFVHLHCEEWLVTCTGRQLHVLATIQKHVIKILSNYCTHFVQACLVCLLPELLTLVSRLELNQAAPLVNIFNGETQAALYMRFAFRCWLETGHLKVEHGLPNSIALEEYSIYLAVHSHSIVEFTMDSLKNPIDVAQPEISSLFSSSFFFLVQTRCLHYPLL